MFLRTTIQKGILLMQINYTKFRPDIEGVKVKKSYFFENTYHIDAIRIDKRPVCCDRKMNIKEYKKVHIKDKNYGTSKVIIHVRKQRYVCPCCNKKETGKLNFVQERHSISKNIVNDLTLHFSHIKSFKQIGNEVGISLSSVIRYFMKLEIKTTNKITDTIHFDEFKGNADREKYQLAVYNGKRELLTILKDRKSNTIKEYLESLPTKPSKVVIDLFMQFRNVIKIVLPNAEIIADKYHYVRQTEWMIRAVRIRLYNQDVKYKELKKYWKLIALNPINLSKKQQKKIEKLKKLSEIFSKSYEYKVKFYELINVENLEVFEEKLKDLIVELENSEIKECIYLSRTYKNWEKKIINPLSILLSNEFSISFFQLI